ncbi:MAG: hypothetical protein KKB50_07870 [Planctomycetes bacterium]|nr:hypothetical protein [Planctomycetota bacterium]
MDEWKRTFAQKLTRAQNQWVRRFEDVLDDTIAPVFGEITKFVDNHGFQVSTPLCEEGRRSFKFELAENAYLLIIFRSTGVGEFELRSECFVPGCEPVLDRSVARVPEVDSAWAEKQFQGALDTFVELLSGSVPEPVQEVVVL